MCCQVEISATGRSTVWRNPTESGVSDYDLGTSAMRKPWATRGVEPWEIYMCVYIYIYIYIYIYRVSQEEGTKLRDSVPYVKIYRYNPKHIYPKLNG